MEQLRRVTFRDAKFGGLAVGLVEDSVRAPLSPACALLDTGYSTFEEAAAELFSCQYSTTSGIATRMPDDTNAEFSLMKGVDDGRYPRGALMGVFRNGSWTRRYFVYADLFVEGQGFRLSNRLGVEQGLELADRMLNGMGIGCSGRNLSNVEGGEAEWTVTGYVTGCSSGEIVPNTLKKFGEAFFVINDEELQVLDLRNEQYVSGDELLLLLRQQPILNVVPLSIAAVLILVVRAVVRWGTNNDVHRGLELIMKHNLGMKSCDSMLQSRRVVRFEDIVATADSTTDLDFDDYVIEQI